MGARVYGPTLALAIPAAVLPSPVAKAVNVGTPKADVTQSVSNGFKCGNNEK